MQDQETITMNDCLIERASAFAHQKHKDQQRKYTGEPYFNHCKEVAALVYSLGGDEHMIAAAYLHDTVEDCGVTLQEIQENFGEDVMNLVSDLTDVSKPSDGNRKIRKKIDRMHTAKASPRAKTIKLADIISNTIDIVEQDPRFAKIYLEEKALLLPHLTEGNNVLWNVANNIIEKKNPLVMKKLGD